MKAIADGHDHIYDVPETWAEAEKMITDALKQSKGRGRNLEIQAICARIAFGMCCDQELTPDPLTALAFLIQRICQRKGAGLER